MSDDDFKIFLRSKGLRDKDYSKLIGIHMLATFSFGELAEL